MNKILLSISSLLFLVMFSCGGNDQKIDFELTSQQLYQEFQDNEIAASDKYEGKRLKVHGYLISFSKTLGTNYCTIGSPGDLIGEVSVAMSDEFAKNAGNFKKGDYMWVTGVCTGSGFTGIVNLE